MGINGKLRVEGMVAMGISINSLSVLMPGILHESIIAEENLYSRNDRLLHAEGKALTKEILNRINSGQVYVRSNGELARRSANMVTQVKKPIQPRVVTTHTARVVSKFHQLSIHTYCDLMKLVKNLYKSGAIDTDNVEKVERTIFELVGEILIKGNWYFNYNVYRTISNYEIVHSANVVLISVLIGNQLKMSPTQLSELMAGALAHDLERKNIPKEIRNKLGKLTQEEFEIVKKHTETSVTKEHLKVAIEQHHERWNGQGYPNKLAYKSIHIYAQIIAVADTYDALIARRPHRDAWYLHKAYNWIISRSGIDFSPEVIIAFKKAITLYPPSSIVILNTGDVGIVEKSIAGQPDLPEIRLLFNSAGEYYEANTTRNLSQYPDIFVIKLNPSKEETETSSENSCLWADIFK
ncbi:MAG: HD domain-containing protein [Desulfosporosinus sp.]|nr:HD domain-containing protein [Desulfosporosinus sp.]